MKTLHMNLGADSYDIILERGALHKAGEYLNLDRRVLIVTDAGVPAEYAEAVAEQSKHSRIVIIDPPGEQSKTIQSFTLIQRAMLDEGFDRGDCVLAVGGGVVGDLAGFAAACYMRGIDFYNIPTTVLSQVDSSIGGKTAVNLDSVKNIIGAFHQPRRVLIDLDLLRTLDRRQVSSGLAEALKMSLTGDPELFEIFENGDIDEHMDEIIHRSLMIKQQVVEQDEKEQGLRKVLNFGHTIGHGIESLQESHGLFHGECVALGMLPMVSDALRPRVIAVLERLGLPTGVTAPPDRVLAAMAHDKKSASDGITVVKVDEIGSFRFEKMTLDALYPLIKTVCKEA